MPVKPRSSPWGSCRAFMDFHIYMGVCQLLSLISTPSFHIIASPPLLPSLGTIIPCVYSNLFLIPFILLSPVFVSARKISRGSLVLTSSASVRTARDDPMPRQFQAKIIMRLGSAALQQPPLRQPSLLPHLVCDS
nr:hypothetical protein CFP56_35737 [Quercus suber]